MHRVIFGLGRSCGNGMKRRVQSMPRQNCTFHARWKIAHACKHSQPAQMVRIVKTELADRHVAEFPYEDVGIRTGLSFDRSSHHGCRRLADGAGFAVEGNLIDMLPFEMEIDVQMISAQRIMTDCMMAGVSQRTVVARLLVVVEDNFLVKGFWIHYVKIFWTVRRPSMNASTSAIVL